MHFRWKTRRGITYASIPTAQLICHLAGSVGRIEGTRTPMHWCVVCYLYHKNILLLSHIQKSYHIILTNGVHLCTQSNLKPKQMYAWLYIIHTQRALILWLTELIVQGGQTGLELVSSSGRFCYNMLVVSAYIFHRVIMFSFFFFCHSILVWCSM